MGLLKKIFPISAKFVGSTKNLILGGLIYIAIQLVSIPLMFIGGLGTLIVTYADLGMIVMLLMHFGAFNEDDTMGDVFRKVFPFSYKTANDKTAFVAAIFAHIIGLFTSFSGYAFIGLILLIVDYCVNNKKEKAEAAAE